MNSMQYIMQGIAYYGEGDYSSAIISYENALNSQDKNLQDNTAILYTHKATALAKLNRYDEAIYNYTFAINYSKDPTPISHYGRGMVMIKLCDYQKAIEDFNSAIQFSDNFGLAYYGRAITYMKLRQYKAAENDYNKLIELWNYLPCALFFNGLGCAKYNLCKHEEAIECYNSAIDIDPHFIAAYNNRGNAYYKLNKYHNALNDFNIAISLNPQNEKKYQWQSLFDYPLPDFVDDVKTYLTAIKSDNIFFTALLMDVLRLMKVEKEDYSTIAKALINSNHHFLKTTATDIDNRDIYSMIYLQVMKIMSLLHIDNITLPISHYTSTIVAKSLLFESSPLRFSSIERTNDEYEGLMLHLFLNIKENLPSDTQAYIACFVLGQDNHNMFRLYGKTNNEESSGICLCLKGNFFTQKMTFDIEERQEKVPIFRCVYVNYDKNYSDKSMYVSDIGGNVSEDIKRIKTEVQTNLFILKKIIQTNSNLSIDVINKLIKPLQYLIKIDSWKEEKECRALKVASFDNPLILRDEGKQRAFLNYLTISEFVDRIYIGCNAFKDKRSCNEFINHVKRLYPNINCILSKHKNRI